MAEMALERGLLIHASCIWRWVQIYGRELDKRCRALSFAKNTSDRSLSDISVLAMEQIGLRGHKEIDARDVTGT
jgi:hypothetical protein